MRTMRKSVVLLLLSTCGLVMVDDVSHWKTSGDVGTSSEQIACARKCVAEGAKVCAVLEPDGTCSCDRPDKNIPTNTYMARQGPSLLEKYTIILPFTSTANSFEALGTENVQMTVVGSPMQFTQDGPSGFPVVQKVLHLQGTRYRYLKYYIPQSLIDSALADGFIIAYWVNFLASATEFIWEFYDGVDGRGIRFRQDPAGSVFFATSSFAMAQYPVTSGWHHYAAVYSKSTGITELFQDGVSKGTGTGDPFFREILFLVSMWQVALIQPPLPSIASPCKPWVKKPRMRSPLLFKRRGMFAKF